jgi:glycerate 2-kinase
MRLLLAFDKFKDCMTAETACEAARRGVVSVWPQADVICRPLADGGEGFAGILTRAGNGQTVDLDVMGPRGDPVRAAYGLVPADHIPPAALALAGLPSPKPGSTIAVVEMAAASGLAHLDLAARDPWRATTYGTGQVLRHAADAGAAAILLGVGGSATNDLGLGALLALGLRVTGDVGDPPGCPSSWGQMGPMDASRLPPLPPVVIACDVTNPVLGPRGCTRVYGPQKGLRSEDTVRMEDALTALAPKLCATFGREPMLAEVPGSGAAGGIAFGLMAALEARLVPGFALVSAWLNLEREIERADWILTGEGRFDTSSLEGKGPGAVVADAMAKGKRVDVFAGALMEDAVQSGFTATGITPPGVPLREALARGPQFLETAVSKRVRDVASGWTDPSAPPQ